MTRRARILLCSLGVSTLAILAIVVFLERRADAQASGYEGLVLCSLPGATKEEALYATGISTLFNDTFTVRTRNWRWLSAQQLWHGEWWLRSASGWSWVPVGTSMTCSYYPTTLTRDWIE